VVRSGKPCLAGNGFVHLNGGVGVLLIQFPDSFGCVVFHDMSYFLNILFTKIF
jgi:hypothetical protein